MKNKMDYLIFVVDDNKVYNHLMTEFLRKRNYVNVKSLYSGEECIRLLEKGEVPDLVIQDYFLDGMDGIEVLKRTKKISPKSKFIFLSVNESMEVAINTIKLGAYDYVVKNNVALDKVVEKIQKNFKLIELEKKNKKIRQYTMYFIGVVFLVVVFFFLFFVIDVFKVN